MDMIVWRATVSISIERWRSTLLAIVLSTSVAACPRHTPPPGNPACVVILQKIDICDPTSHQMSASYREQLRTGCPAAIRACATIDTSDQTGCRRFMGCLYDPQ